MTFWAILLLLVLVAALVAYVGDQVAKRVGKRHWRFLGLRPRATATLVAVGTGVLIALGGFGTFFVLVKDARETILQADQVRQERNRLRSEVDRLLSRAAATLSETDRLKSERAEFERNNVRLAQQLELYAQQQKQTRQELEATLVESQKLSLEVDKLTTDKQKLEQSLIALTKERQGLQQDKAQLLLSRSQVAIQAQKAQQDLRNLEAASKNALTRYNSLQAQAKVLQARTKTLQVQTTDLQARIALLEADKTKLETDKRNLEGDVAVLVGGKEITAAKGAKDPAAVAASANLNALQKENGQLRDNLGSVQRELQQLRERSRLMVGSLDKALGSYLLAEGVLEPANAQSNVSELLRKADSRSRLLGLRGLEVVESADLSAATGGLLLARVMGVNDDGRVRVRVEYHAKERIFAAGEVLASTSLTLPAALPELRRKLEALSQMATARLSQAGWIPEKISPSIPLDALVGLMGQLSGKRGGVKIAVVATENLYPTEIPKLGLQLLP